MSGKLLAGIVGAFLGVGAVAALLISLFNSKKMRMKRAVGKAGHTMYNIGSLLCGMSSLLGSDGYEKA